MGHHPQPRLAGDDQDQRYGVDRGDELVPSGVYTERFLSTHAVGGWSYYQVPAGMRAIVTAIIAANDGAVAGDASVTIVGAGQIARVSLAAAGTQSIQTRVALYALESIGLYTAGSLLSVTVGGYLFEDSSRRRGAPESELPPPDLEPPEWAP